MKALFFPQVDRKFKDHPKFEGVKICILVSSDDSDKVSVSQLEIAPGIQVPTHTHDIQADSIFVLSGKAEALLNGEWTLIGPGDYIFVPEGVEHGVRNIGEKPLQLFIHHSPPLF